MKRRWRSIETYGSRMQASGYDKVPTSLRDQAREAFLVTVTKAAVPFDDVEMEMRFMRGIALWV